LIGVTRAIKLKITRMGGACSTHAWLEMLSPKNVSMKSGREETT